MRLQWPLFSCTSYSISGCLGNEFPLSPRSTWTHIVGRNPLAIASDWLFAQPWDTQALALPSRPTRHLAWNISDTLWRNLSNIVSGQSNLMCLSKMLQEFYLMFPSLIFKSDLKAKFSNYFIVAWKIFVCWKMFQQFVQFLVNFLIFMLGCIYYHLNNMWQVRFTSRCSLKIKQERKPLCYHFCLNSFCLHLPISFMNMEGICSTLVFVCSLSLTPHVSCWCSRNLNKGVTAYGRRHTLPCGEKCATSVC